MDKNEEYTIRKTIEKIIMRDTEDTINTILVQSKNRYKDLILYPLAVLELYYKKMSMQSWKLNLPTAELLIILNPFREATDWFIREILKRQEMQKAEMILFDYEEEDFGMAYAEKIMSLYDMYSRGKQIGLHRSASRVKLHEIEENKYELLFPKINEEYNKELLYYYGLDDASENEKECEIVTKVEQYLFELFDVKKLVSSPRTLLKYLDKIEIMHEYLDMKLYRLIKTRVSIDVNKIANDIHSDIITDKNELIKVLALFYYLSRLCMQQFSLESIPTPMLCQQRKDYCYINFGKLTSLAEQVGIKKEIIQRYVNYFTLDPAVEKGGLLEFPLLVFDDQIVWIPSSFVLNDFQFSIVNGHYYKDINFPKHEETIAQSIVDYLLDSVDGYENIICAHNYLYSVPGEKYNGKDLQSDIDMALYDKNAKILLIIECKWKTNVYTFTDDYVQIERAVNEVYKKQLNKHKYYLEQQSGRFNDLFENKIDIEKNLDEIKIMYLFIDKRIQFHDQEHERHVVSTFMMSYLFEKFSDGNNLNLKGVCENIQNQNSNVEYERVALKKKVELDGKIFI